MNSEAEQQAWVEKWAQRIEARGLSFIALFLIEIARPFGFLGSQAFLVAQPLLAGIMDDMVIERTTALLDNAELLNRLTARLEGGKVG